MKLAYISFIIILLSGCASQPSINSLAQSGSAVQIENSLNQGARIEALDYWGTPLGYAAKFNNIRGVRLLLKKGANVNGGNLNGNDSKTPLHGAASNGHVEVARILLEHGANPNIKNQTQLTPEELARTLGHVQFAAFMQGYGGSLDAWNTCQGLDTLECYSNFIQKYPTSQYQVSAKNIIANKQQARLQLKAKRKKNMVSLKQQQVCKLKESNWIYQSKGCRSGYADGQGIALHQDGELKFEGKFKNGIRTQGLIYHNDNPLFEGKVVNGKPDGPGVCFHKDEPEECKYYKGKRIDTLFKQRIELAEQRKYMETLKEDMARSNNRSGTTAQSSTMTDHVSDALKKKAADKVADAIFDHLF